MQGSSHRAGRDDASLGIRHVRRDLELPSWADHAACVKRTLRRYHPNTMVLIFVSPPGLTFLEAAHAMSPQPPYRTHSSRMFSNTVRLDVQSLRRSRVTSKKDALLGAKPGMLFAHFSLGCNTCHSSVDALGLIANSRLPIYRGGRNSAGAPEFCRVRRVLGREQARQVSLGNG